ncbi:MAG: Txe/YoeB family addiction module toxin [Sulfuriferula sp.]
MSWNLVFTQHAQKDAQKIARVGLKEKTQVLLIFLQVNPFQISPPYEKLIGDLTGAYSRRIDIRHRLVYQVLPDKNLVKVLRMWSHYE